MHFRVQYAYCEVVGLKESNRVRQLSWVDFMISTSMTDLGYHPGAYGSVHFSQIFASIRSSSQRLQLSVSRLMSGSSRSLPDIRTKGLEWRCVYNSYWVFCRINSDNNYCFLHLLPTSTSSHDFPNLSRWIFLHCYHRSRFFICVCICNRGWKIRLCAWKGAGIVLRAGLC